MSSSFLADCLAIRGAGFLIMPTLSQLRNLSWPGLAMAGLVALSAIPLRRWPLSAVALLLACAIATALAASSLQIASLLIPPAGVAVGFIAATQPCRISIAADLIALGVLARYGTSWPAPELPPTPGRRPSSSPG